MTASASAYVEMWKKWNADCLYKTARREMIASMDDKDNMPWNKMAKKSKPTFMGTYSQ